MDKASHIFEKVAISVSRLVKVRNARLSQAETLYGRIGKTRAHQKRRFKDASTIQTLNPLSKYNRQKRIDEALETRLTNKYLHASKRLERADKKLNVPGPLLKQALSKQAISTQLAGKALRARMGKAEDLLHRYTLAVNGPLNTKPSLTNLSNLRREVIDHHRKLNTTKKTLLKHHMRKKQFTKVANRIKEAIVAPYTVPSFVMHTTAQTQSPLSAAAVPVVNTIKKPIRKPTAKKPQSLTGLNSSPMALPTAPNVTSVNQKNKKGIITPFV